MHAHSEFASSEMVYNQISCFLQEDGTTREGTRENNKNGAKLTILSPGAPGFILPKRKRRALVTRTCPLAQ